MACLAAVLSPGTPPHAGHRARPARPGAGRPPLPVLPRPVNCNNDVLVLVKGRTASRGTLYLT